MNHQSTSAVGPASWAAQAGAVVLALAAIAIDQLTKWRIEATLDQGEFYYPLEAWSEIFRIVHVYNTGAAFGMMQGQGWLLFIVAAGVSAFILYYNYFVPDQYIRLRLALGLILGGALGNAIDRVRIGHVTDFIHFNLRPLVADYPALDFQILNWPVFNWADVFVVSGVVLMSYLLWTGQLPEDEQLMEERAPDAVAGRGLHPETVQTVAFTPPQPLPAGPHYPDWERDNPSPPDPEQQQLARRGLWIVIGTAAALLLWLFLARRRRR